MGAEAVAVLAGLSWIAFQFWLFRGWRSLSKTKTQATPDPLVQTGVSVVIPFRNEQENLPALLDSLKALEAPERLAVEWIFVDDGSEDDGASLIPDINRKCLLSGSVKLLTSQKAGKKAAQLAGVQEARYDWLLFSDADCRWPSDRLRHLEQLSFEKDIQLICGPVIYDKATPFLFAVEFESLVYAGAALTGLGFPVLGNGANILCRKEAWLKSANEVMGMPTPSGDDVFLIQGVARRFGSRAVGFWASASNTVITRGPRTAREFLEQRMRWVSKTPFFQSFMGKAVASYVWLFHTFLMVSPGACFLKEYNHCAVIFWAVKILGDSLFYFFVSQTARSQSWKKFILFLPAEVFITFHFVFTPLLALIRGYTWKGRAFPGRSM